MSSYYHTNQNSNFEFFVENLVKMKGVLRFVALNVNKVSRHFFKKNYGK